MRIDCRSQIYGSEKCIKNKLAKQVSEINKRDKVFFMADKTTNIYKVSPEKYHKLLLENVTKDYKLVTEAEVDKINLEAKKIAV